MIYTEWLEELGLFNLEKGRLRGGLITEQFSNTGGRVIIRRIEIRLFSVNKGNLGWGLYHLKGD